jgi:hypothetical protein
MRKMHDLRQVGGGWWGSSRKKFFRYLFGVDFQNPSISKIHSVGGHPLPYKGILAAMTNRF